MADVITSEELVEVRASIVLTIPPGITFEEALKAAIFAQSWAEKYPDSAQSFYDSLISDPELIDLLDRFPREVSIEELLAKVQELAERLKTELADQLNDLIPGASEDALAFRESVWQFIQTKWLEVAGPPPDNIKFDFDNDKVINDAIRKYYEGGSWDALTDAIIAEASKPDFYPVLDLALLTADIPTLYKLLSWNPVAEQLLINQLRENLKKLDEMRMHIGGQVVLVPFLGHFEIFLTKMEERQTELEGLWAEYFGEGDNGKEWRAKVFKWLTDNIFSQENVEGGFELFKDITPLGATLDLAKLGWEHLVEPAIGKDLANRLLAVPAIKIWEVSQTGTNLQEALIYDPKNALTGIAVGMVEASPLGLFLDISAAYVSNSFETYNKYGANLPIIKPGWWKDLLRIDTTNAAFLAGESAGVVGMTVSNLVVNIATVPGSASMGGSMGAVPAGDSVLAWSNGVMTLEQAKSLGLVGVGTVGVVQGGYQAGQFFANQDEGDTSLPSESKPSSPKNGDLWRKPDGSLWRYEEGLRRWVPVGKLPIELSDGTIIEVSPTSIGEGRCADFAADFSTELRARGVTFKIGHAFSEEGSVLRNGQPVSNAGLYHYYIEYNGYIYDNLSYRNAPLMLSDYHLGTTQGTLLKDEITIGPETPLDEILRFIRGG